MVNKNQTKVMFAVKTKDPKTGQETNSYLTMLEGETQGPVQLTKIIPGGESVEILNSGTRVVLNMKDNGFGQSAKPGASGAPPPGVKQLTPGIPGVQPGLPGQIGGQPVPAAGGVNVGAGGGNPFGGTGGIMVGGGGATANYSPQAQPVVNNMTSFSSINSRAPGVRTGGYTPTPPTTPIPLPVPTPGGMPPNSTPPPTARLPNNVIMPPMPQIPGQ
jgi:hypothetical protein